MMAGEEESSSSGCQSGWTVYFDQSYMAPDPPLSPNYGRGVTDRFELSREEEEEEEEEDEEDLSMISDASSGPPHLDTEEQHSECGTLRMTSEFRKKRKADDRASEEEDAKRDHYLCSSLDDTASSPMLNHSNSTGTAATDMEATAESALEFSCAFSGTYIKEESVSVSRNDMCYLQPIASLKLQMATPAMYMNKKIKRRINGDAFALPSWSSHDQEQSMQEEFL